MLNQILDPNKRYYPLVDGLRSAWTRMWDPKVLVWTGVMELIGIGAAMLNHTQTGANANIGTLFCFSMGISFLLSTIISRQAVAAAMRRTGLPLVDPLPRMLDWLALQIQVWFLTITSWYDKRMMAIGAASFIAAVLGFAFTRSYMIYFLLIIPFGLVLLVNITRLLFAEYMLLRGDGSPTEMPRKSWDLVNGQTVQVALPCLAIGVIIAGITHLVYTILPAPTMTGYIVHFGVGWAIGAYGQVFNADLFRFFVHEAHAASPHLKHDKKK